MTPSGSSPPQSLYRRASPAGSIRHCTNLGRVRRRLETLSDRCPPPLTKPLQTVAAAVAKLQTVPVPTDTEVQRAYTKAVQTERGGES